MFFLSVLTGVTGGATDDQEEVGGPVEVLAEGVEEVVGVQLDEAWSGLPKMVRSCFDSKQLSSTPRVLLLSSKLLFCLLFFIPTKSGISGISLAEKGPISYPAVLP